jgi:hypothetical protein
MVAASRHISESLGLGQTIGLEEFTPEQEIWRFMPWHRAKDLVFKNEIYLSSINTLREKIDIKECRLPEILSKAVVASPADYRIKEFMRSSFKQLEAHSDIVFASCWFLPSDSSIEAERGMWEEFGDHPEGGIRVRSTIRSLVAAIPETERVTFGLGRIHYLPNSIRADEAFDLKGHVLPGQYLSNPFLLKMEKYQKERELRLFHRWTRCTLKNVRFWTPPLDDGADERGYWITDNPLAGLRIKVRRTTLIHGLSISPLCAETAQARIREELTNFGFPPSRFDTSALAGEGERARMKREPVETNASSGNHNPTL